MLDLLSDAPRAELNLRLHFPCIEPLYYLALALVEGYKEHVEVLKSTVFLF